MSDFIQTLLASLPSIIISAVAVYYSYKASSNSNKAAVNLENYKNELAKEFLRLNFLYSKESTLLDELWRIAAKTFNCVLTLRFSFGSARIGDLDDTQLEEFLFETGFLESDKNAIRNSDTRQDTYDKINKHYFVLDAKRSVVDLKRFIDEQRLYIPLEIRDPLIDIIALMVEIEVIADDLVKDPEDPSITHEDRVRHRKNFATLEDKKELLASLIRKRLYNNSSTRE